MEGHVLVDKQFGATQVMVGRIQNHYYSTFTKPTDNFSFVQDLRQLNLFLKELNRAIRGKSTRELKWEINDYIYSVDISMLGKINMIDIQMKCTDADDYTKTFDMFVNPSECAEWIELCSKNIKEF